MAIAVKVGGEVRVRDGNSLTTEYYEREFELDDSVGTDEGVIRSILRKGFIVEDLRKTVKGYKSVRTMSIISIDQRPGKAEVSELGKLTSKAVKSNAMPDNLDLYGSEAAKIEALKRSIEKKQSHDKAPVKKDEQVQGLGYID